MLSLRDDKAVARDEARHKKRWERWLRLGNLLQFLSGPRRDAILTSRAHSEHLDWADYDLVTGAAVPDREIEFSDADLVNPVAVDMVLALIGELGEEPELGMELGSGAVVEAAFNNARVAVVVGLDDERDEALRADGWNVRGAGDEDGQAE